MIRLSDSMTQAITTRYMGPTNTRGSRIVATSASGQRVTVGYLSELNSWDNHAEACRALCSKLNWNEGDWISGGTKDGYVFVDARSISIR